MSTDVEALSSLLDIVQRKKSGFEEKGNCIREEVDCTVDLLRGTGPNIRQV